MLRRTAIYEGDEVSDLAHLVCYLHDTRWNAELVGRETLRRRGITHSLLDALEFPTDLAFEPQEIGAVLHDFVDHGRERHRSSDTGICSDRRRLRLCRSISHTTYRLGSLLVGPRRRMRSVRPSNEIVSRVHRQLLLIVPDVLAIANVCRLHGLLPGLPDNFRDPELDNSVAWWL